MVDIAPGHWPDTWSEPQRILACPQGIAGCNGSIGCELKPPDNSSESAGKDRSVQLE